MDAVTETRRQANTAQEQLVASTRPWIKVEGFELSDLRLDEITLSIWVKITIKNIGQAPAESVFVSPNLILPHLEVDRAAETVDLCRKARVGELRPIFPSLLFPGDTKALEPQVGVVHFSRFTVEIAAARNKMLNDWHANARTFIGDDEAAAGRAEKASYPYHSPLALAGCITYTSNATPLAYQTAFLVDLGRKMPGAPFGRGAFDLSRPSTVPAHDIIVGEPDLGTFTHRWSEQGNQ